MRVARILCFVTLFTGCATHPDYATDFRFPINWGDVDRGRAAFVELQCNRCHTVSGVELPAYTGESPAHFELGGSLTYVKTYADLVTSLLNPGHEVSERYRATLPEAQRRGARSMMPFNEKMTVVQLIDLVTFLNSRYQLLDGYQEIYFR